MSLIQKIQEKGAWIIFILIALALIAFIMMDSSFSRGNLFSNTTVVGKINGEKIQKSDFEAKLDMIQQMQGQQAAPREQLSDQVWNYLVQLTALQQQFKALGLGFTSKELDAALFGANPPQFMRQQFTDPKTGVFNADAARQAFGQLKKQTGQNKTQIDQFFTAYIQPLIDQSLAQKYQSLITGAAYIPSWLAAKESADNSTIASFAYVNVPYTSIPDDQAKVSDEDIKAYVRKHPKQFEQKYETRNISYVSFNAAPSNADSNAVRSELETLKQPFALAADVKDFVATKGGDAPYYEGYVTAQDIQIADKEDFLKTPVGAVYGPYLDKKNFSLAKLIASSPIADSAKVRHILVATVQQDPQSGQQVRDDSAALKRLDSAIAALNHGAKFDSIVAIYSDDPGSKETGGVIDYFTPGRMVPEFNDFAFAGHVGEKKTVHTNFGYHYVEILDQKGRTQGYKVAYVSKAINASSATINTASNNAAQFAAASNNAGDFKANAGKSKLQVSDFPNIKENDFQVGQLGSSRSLVKWIFANKQGTVSEPTQVGDYYVVALVTGIRKPGLADAATARPLIESIVRNEKKALQIIQNKFKGNTLESYAQSAGVQVQKADSVSFASPFIPGIGGEPKVVGAAFNKAYINKVTAPLAGNSGVFAVRPASISAVPSGGDPAQMRSALRQQLLQQISYKALSALTEAADVKDYRASFY